MEIRREYAKVFYGRLYNFSFAGDRGEGGQADFLFCLQRWGGGAIFLGYGFLYCLQRGGFLEDVLEGDLEFASAYSGFVYSKTF